MSFDPIAYLEEPRWRSSRLGLERITELLMLLENPQDRCKFVHIAGTNGKGSTSAFVASVLESAGYTTGLFTSPYIVEFADRIRVNGNNIAHEDLCDITLEVKKATSFMTDHPTEFELFTAVAFMYFARKNCDIAVVEVGMGGRLDSTNVLKHPEVSVITSLSLDHIGFLGDTLEAIAFEKAGIIKKDVPVVSYPQLEVPMKVIERVVAENTTQLTIPDFSRLSYDQVRYSQDDTTSVMRHFSYKHYENLEIKVLGSYQPKNAALAIEVLEKLSMLGWDISEKDIRKGLRSVQWPARFEVIPTDPPFVIDGGHNVEGVKALVESLREVFFGRKVVYILGVLADKHYEDMFGLLVPYAKACVAITVPNERALSAEEISQSFSRLASEMDNSQAAKNCLTADTLEDALGIAYAQADKDDVICACGSLYSVADLKLAHDAWLREHPERLLR